MLANLYPELKGTNRGIPVHKTIQKWRDDIGKLNDLQVRKFVEDADELVVCVDQRYTIFYNYFSNSILSPTLGGDNCTAIGVSDQNGAFKILKVDEAEGKDGKSIANEVLSTLDEFNARDKVTFIQSDSARGLLSLVLSQITLIKLK